MYEVVFLLATGVGRENPLPWLEVVRYAGPPIFAHLPDEAVNDNEIDWSDVPA
jgi:hypothetical protein